MPNKISSLAFMISVSGLFWAYAGYPAFIWALARIFKKAHRYDGSCCPAVSFIITAYNDENVIGQKLENTLALDYPREKLEVLIVNDNSCDTTKDIVENYIQKQGLSNFILINQPRRGGYNESRNTALKLAKYDIVAFSDGNALLDKDALKRCAGHFWDLKVGCVGCQYVNKIAVRTQESKGAFLYHRFQNFLYRNEFRIGGAHTSNGWFQLFRKRLLDCREKRISAVDWDMTLSIKKQGYDIVHEPKGFAYKFPAQTAGDLFLQMRRTLVGVIICIFKYKALLNPFKYGLWAVCFFSNRTLQTLTPFFIILFLFPLYMACAGSYFMLAGLLFLAGLAVTLFAPLRFFILMNAICVVAWVDYFRHNYSPIWEPIGSARQRL